MSIAYFNHSKTIKMKITTCFLFFLSLIFSLQLSAQELNDTPAAAELKNIFGDNQKIAVMDSAQLSELFVQIRNKECQTDLASQMLSAIGTFKKLSNAAVVKQHRLIDRTIEGSGDGEMDGYIKFDSEEIQIYLEGLPEVKLKIKEYWSLEVMQWYVFPKNAHLISIGCDYRIINVEGLDPDMIFRDITGGCIGQDSKD